MELEDSGGTSSSGPVTGSTRRSDLSLEERQSKVSHIISVYEDVQDGFELEAKQIFEE